MKTAAVQHQSRHQQQKEKLISINAQTNCDQENFLNHNRLGSSSSLSSALRATDNNANAGRLNDGKCDNANSTSVKAEIHPPPRTAYNNEAASRQSISSVTGLLVDKNKRAAGPRLKKKVSFSDHVELVAHSADIEEVHLPNPLLDRILGKSYLKANNINNGQVLAGGVSNL